MWGNLVRFGQFGLLLLVGIALFFWSRLATYVPFDQTQLLGTTIALVAAIAFYFDRVLVDLRRPPRSIRHSNLAAALTEAFEAVPQPETVRIVALSTHMIQPFLLSIKARTNRCMVLAYDPSASPPRGASRQPVD